MNESRCTLTFKLEGAAAVDEAKKMITGSSLTGRNLTSDTIGHSSEGNFIEVNAEELRDLNNEGLETQITYLPILGNQGLIAKGWSHILAGYPKTGKTELLIRAVAEWRNETLLYITEEPQQVWSHRLRRLSGDLRFDHISLMFALGTAPEIILNRVQDGHETVVIIDTIRSFLGFVDETDNSEVNRVIAPYIQAAREKNKTIIFVHHMRKGGGKHGQGITGAHAFLGSVDIGLVLERPKGQKANRRMISGEARIFEIDKCLYERLEDESFQVIGAADSLALDQVKGRIFIVMDSSWKSTKEIQLTLGNPKPCDDQILKAVQALAEEGIIERSPPLSDGKQRGKTYRWRIDPKPAEANAWDRL